MSDTMHALEFAHIVEMDETLGFIIIKPKLN